MVGHYTTLTLLANNCSLNPEPQTSKRPACHLGDDHYLWTSLLTINDQEAPTIITYHQKTKTSIHLNLTKRSSRIFSTELLLPLKFVRFTLNERHLSIPVSTSDHHERQDQLTKKFFTNINTSYSHTLDSIAKQITLPLVL
ncbi:hypothetical protein KEM48_010045 [Puccinia striiformis f. sp. tritici PST-130]|nr:hypothetical protein KEM48_010045 [Puccinia striiformis f. sp. tritici PST-130]